MNKFEAHIMVVDDDDGIRNLVKKYLNENNFLVTTANNAEDAEEKIKVIKFDLIVLDIMMPGESGLDFISKNKDKYNTPIILLTAKGEANERVEGLEVGADDYLPKPFEPRELLLRVEAILKRSAIRSDKNSSQKIWIGELAYDTSRWELWKGDKRIHLTTAEIKLLHLLSSRLNSVVSRDDLIRSISVKPNNSEESQNKLRTIDVQIKRLRTKLETDPKVPRYLKTIRGQGYILQPD